MNEEELEKLFNQMKNKQDFMENLINLMALTGDKQMLYVQAEHRLNTKFMDISKAISMRRISPECLVQLTNLVKQFQQLLDDLLAEHNIKL